MSRGGRSIAAKIGSMSAIAGRAITANPAQAATAPADTARKFRRESFIFSLPKNAGTRFAPCVMSLTQVVRPTDDPKTITIQMRVSEEYVAGIDEWRAKQRPIPSRSEAIRQLTAIALGKAPKTKAVRP
jgi:hypothetical protein